MTDIWHTADEYNYSTIAFPEDAIVVDTGGGKYWAYSSFYDMPHHCDDPDCCFAVTSCWKRWAKLDDLLAFETELERTRKAFEKAVDGLLAVWRATDHTTKQGSIAYNILCDLNIKPLDRIKALEQKDHFADTSKKVEQKDK